MTKYWQRKTVAALAFLGLAALSQTASAQCTPTATTGGPDVIVGDLNGVANYTAVGNIEALAIGTTSCNIGDVWLNWISSNNQHPVIGQTLYRYKVVNGAGQFEQVGQGWLKHGFFALSQGLCCTGCQSTDGSHLGVKCSDPYTAARNGSQSGLGPKWQVNAHTGGYSYPPANPAWGGSIARRVQVDVADLEVTGGTTRYFGTGHYVTPDDAAAGKQNNNESWREATVSGSGTAWTFGFTGATQRTQYALRSWKSADAAVTLNEIQVPGDGLLIVGFRATPIAGGLHHYEYAVQNLNNDRSVYSFSVPIGAGVTLSNIGFNDVTYHSGDGESNVSRDGTDWSVSQSGGAITWNAAQTFGANANGNAIRWGTTFSFRFDADAAPTTGLATLGHWKIAGTSTTNVDVPGVGGPASLAFCFGDGSGTACPCANNSTPGNNEGCLNSLGTGASLTTTGTGSVSADTLALVGNGMPDSSALYFQGTTQQSGGAGAVFGDGLRCAAGSIIRLGTKLNSLGSSQYPVGGDQPISIRGAVAAGDVRTYQVWYRNAAAFCTASTFNVSNGFQQVWAL